MDACDAHGARLAHAGHDIFSAARSGPRARGEAVTVWCNRLAGAERVHDVATSAQQFRQQCRSAWTAARRVTAPHPPHPARFTTPLSRYPTPHRIVLASSASLPRLPATHSPCLASPRLAAGSVPTPAQRGSPRGRSAAVQLAHSVHVACARGHVLAPAVPVAGMVRGAATKRARKNATV